MTWAVESLDSARSQLGSSLWRRLDPDTRDKADWVRFPVAFVWLRGSRAGAGEELSKQAIASYGYWNDVTQGFFDIVFPGWLAEGVGTDRPWIGFDERAFERCTRDVEAISKWRYRDGVSEVLLLHWSLDLRRSAGDFSFDTAVSLPVETLIQQGKVGSLDEFMGELIRHAKSLGAPGAGGGVWEIANRMAIDRGRRSAWEWINRTFLRGAGTVVDELRPFQVCDLRA